jgi:hypothetical protein
MPMKNLTEKETLVVPRSVCAAHDCNNLVEVSEIVKPKPTYRTFHVPAFCPECRSAALENDIMDFGKRLETLKGITIQLKPNSELF